MLSSDFKKRHKTSWPICLNISPIVSDINFEIAISNTVAFIPELGLHISDKDLVALFCLFLFFAISHFYK